MISFLGFDIKLISTKKHLKNKWGIEMLKNKIGALFCCMVLCASFLTGCGNDQTTTEKNSSANTETSTKEVSNTEVSEKNEKLIFVNFRDIRDLNPHLYAGEMYAQHMLYDRLINVTEEGYEPALAESWTISDDGKVYTFKIRDNAKFSDGEVCDANSIQANFDAILENKDRHTWLEMIQLLDKTEAVDDSTFRITMTEPYYPMLTELGVTRPFGIISPQAMKNGSTKDGVSSYIGTGPYMLTDFVTDEYAVFEVNPYYWGEAPKIQKIRVKVIPDNQTRILALQNGEIDLIYGKDMLDADAIKQFENNDQFSVGLSEPTATRQIVLNTQNEILSNINVRKALQHATNQEAISEGIFYGLEQPAGTLFPTTLQYANVGLVPYDYNVETAAKMLDEAGWIEKDGKREKNGQTLTLNLLYNSDSVTEKTIAEYLQSEYAKLGITLTITGEEEQSYRDNMKAGNFDMIFNICWGSPYDPQSSLSAMRRPVYGDFAAQQGLEDKAAIDEAITNILVSTDETKRQELYKEVLTRLHEDAIYIPITYECNKALYRSDLQGVEFQLSPYEIKFQSMYFE